MGNGGDEGCGEDWGTGRDGGGQYQQAVTGALSQGQELLCVPQVGVQVYQQSLHPL